ncbi:MAG: hypothetical protein GXO47_00900 [Chlorobi bacterium]|nr:hypothetical protein [Chlorobiota bacterium]
MLKNALKAGSKYVDYKMGIIGSFVMAVVIFSINYFGKNLPVEYAGNPFFWSVVAALKQGTYTFFFGGIIMKMSERLATEISNKPLALVLACLVPSLVSITLTFTMHSMKGTPKPLESTIPTMIFVFPSTAVWGLMRRRKMEKMQEDKDVTAEK